MGVLTKNSVVDEQPHQTVGIGLDNLNFIQQWGLTI